jgi:hypothetical protein
MAISTPSTKTPQLVLSATILTTPALIGASGPLLSAPLHPVAAPGMCRYHTDPSRTQGFRDYCLQ